MLYKGIFWIVNRKYIESNMAYCIKLSCDINGIPLNELECEGVSKSGDNYNHKKYWEILDRKLTNNKSYNYYPRGRVEIKNSKVMVFLNPIINTEEIQDFIIDEYKLNTEEIKKIDFKVDGSNHYKSHLDR